MRVLLGLVCFIAPLISSAAVECEEQPNKIILFSSANEIDIRDCPLSPNEKKGTILWYKNDSKTLISMEQDSRIHQQNQNLWFVPAKVEDSGHYYCVVRNSTYCLKTKITVKVLENDPGLCFNTQTTFIQRLHIGGDGSLVCPYLDFFKDEYNELPKVQWYKDCKPLLLDNRIFFGVSNKLILRNVAEDHRGNYTCHVSYIYSGKHYPVTRVIEFITLDEIKPDRPVIVSPANETVEVEPGSMIQLICNVTGQLTDLVYWKWNGSEIEEDDPLLVEDYQQMGNLAAKRKYTHITTLNISEVKSHFYQYPFTCFVRTSNTFDAAYIQLIYPIPDFKNYLIGTFVILTAVIICCVFICKIFKVDIVLWYRDSCSDFLPPKASDGKTYDAYILYPKTFREGATSNLDIFVFKLLPEVLEDQFGYKLFIYGRDDYVGEDSVNVTNENVKKSRRLIVVLMREMGGFSWLGHSSEEQIAMYNALIQDGIKVVLLELEKIQDYEKMPESIKFIKQKHGAIRWSGDFKERPQSAKTRFWKNVRYHMPAQRPSPSSKHQILPPDPQPDTKEKLQNEVHLPLG
ncbi:interleukin-1 receptor type 1 [Nannospalax galili]|nr:interleukin-1 receptor type 1 [Nannospalax galili]XP_017656776.1 interleukin-1 receptor type 1 [Nannospalax galili]XP_017656777.1 interleukin-1 receptor type 1 [Nannospalax galili]XP_017656778.1 interleukin-1 receptor type 1 [Nannospalax galili]XP_029425587.1 interleukin-1 receptor type 1 [Nannospalax galili]XP_029425588.1 interleukin-1 receptor type 1 [Nannospalax galili]XP_029425589.1 interleukin-1 receptor type 1 [Nannospalax galili]XP_029425590.1 interleukin-1 receptor type 1 [Nannosp